MSVLKKFFEFVEQREENIDMPMETGESTQDLQAELDKLKSNKGGQFTYNGYEISLPSELNDFTEMQELNESYGEEFPENYSQDDTEEGEEEASMGGKKPEYKFLVIKKDGGKHAQASEEEVKKLVKEQILFESFRQRNRLRKRK